MKERSTDQSTTMMIMTMEETAIVLRLLQSDLRPIEDILSEFSSKFPRSRDVTVCSSISLLLEARLLEAVEALWDSARLIAFAIIYHCYSSDASLNPFLPGMISAACNEQVEKHERAFILHLLQWASCNNAKEILKLSAVEFIISFYPSTQEFPKLRKLQRKFGNKSFPGPSSHIFLDHFLKNSPKIDDTDETLSRILASLTLDTRRCEIVSKLLDKGSNTLLSPSEKEVITSELETDPKLICDVGITPRKMLKLVENNPQTAVEVLVKLINSLKIDAYLNALASMDISSHTMLVVYRLTIADKLPKGFIRRYITKCISSCENFKRRDKHMLSSRVWLVCAFVRSLMQRETIDVNDIPIEEIQAFCIKFSRISGVVPLFKLSKTLE